MKSTIILCIVCFISMHSFAQKITVNPVSENLGGGHNPAFQVFIPHASVKSVEKKWNRFLKDYHAKVKTSKDEITGQNFILKSKDTMQVFSRINENAEGVTLTAAFSSGGTFVAPGTLQSEYEVLDRLLKEFALPIARDGLEEKANDANDLLKEKTKAYETLVKRNEHLHDANEKMKSEISDNEREIRENEGKIGSMKTVVEQQKKAVEEIKAKSKEME